MRGVVSLCVSAIVLVSLLSVPAALAAPPISGTGAPSSTVSSACIAHRPLHIAGTFEPWYSAGCTGHDEPELDPVSTAPNSARDLTWTAILPSDGSVPVSAVGPTFWFGGTVTDPNSLFGQAFVELQFYPDALVSSCSSTGGFSVSFVPNDYTVCSPVWKVTPKGFVEKAAFNAMLTDSSTPGEPLVMHGGDTITVHWFTTAAADGFHVTVRDLTSGSSGTIVLNSPKDGPLMPAYSTQTIGNALAWGVVNDTPNAFVWEIGHTSVFSHPAAQYCVPGQVGCDSYNAASWAGTMPIRIVSVTFGDGSTAKTWAVVSDFGGTAEVNSYCSSYGGPYCIYPWYSLGNPGTSPGFRYGVDYPATLKDFGQADQFATTPRCGGPFGADTTYCDTVIVP